jgi:hypothetical protein
MSTDSVLPRIASWAAVGRRRFGHGGLWQVGPLGIFPDGARDIVQVMSETNGTRLTVSMRRRWGNRLNQH